ncbi:MAG: hypothetical protein ACRD2E_08820 [Terriglobales bacterium]
MKRTWGTTAGATGEAGRGPGWLDSPPARVAVEIAAGGVLAARLQPGRGVSGGSAAVAERPLPADSLQPGLTVTNVTAPGALTAALRQCLEAVGGVGREAALLLPDLAFRVALLDFDELPRRGDELDALVRFRLRKTLPFDADQAALSVQVLRTGLRRGVVAVTADRERLNEYEDAFEAAGGRAAQLLPAGLAALMALPAFGHGTLLLRWRGGALTSGFGWEDLPRLFRVVPTGNQLAYDDLHASAAFFRDFHESLPPPERETSPRILTFGVPEATAAQLGEECPWAEVRAGAGAWGTRESQLAVLGALHEPYPPAASGAGSLPPALPPDSGPGASA